MLASLGSMKQVGPATRSYIIVSSSSTVRSFSELHGHSMVFLDPESIVGGAYPAYRALNDGYQAASFFSKIKYSYSLEDSLSIVSLGIEDAGAIDGSFWDLVAIEDPDVIKKLRVIERSPWVGTPVVVASSDLSTSLQSQMMNVLLDASTDPDAVRILKNLQYNRFFPYDASRYTEIDRMVSALKEHKEWPLPTQL
jgi:phosphonate transport system substrate-binding protein